MSWFIWFTYIRCALLGFVLSLLPLPTFANDVPAIAAASSLQSVLQEAAVQFHADSGKSIRLSFGSSGNIYRQLRQGAPFQLFFSADESYIHKLAQAGLTVDEGKRYANGRIVLFAPQGSPLKVDEQGNDLKAALDDGRLQRFAIANPVHAPYGRAAKQTLQALGIWEKIQPKLVLGENVAQAAQFATSGSTQGGIFAYSFALMPEIKQGGTFVLLPEQHHQVLSQRMVLIKNAGKTAQQFYRYVQQTSAHALFKRYGFSLPSE